MEVKPVVSNLDGQNAWLQVTYPLNHPLKHFFFLFKVFLNERIGTGDSQTPFLSPT